MTVPGSVPRRFPAGESLRNGPFRHPIEGGPGQADPLGRDRRDDPRGDGFDMQNFAGSMARLPRTRRFRITYAGIRGFGPCPFRSFSVFIIFGHQFPDFETGATVKVRIAILALLAAWLPIATLGNVRAEGKTITFAVGGASAEFDFWERLVRDFTAETGIGAMGSRRAYSPSG